MDTTAKIKQQIEMDIRKVANDGPVPSRKAGS